MKFFFSQVSDNGEKYAKQPEKAHLLAGTISSQGPEQRLNLLVHKYTEKREYPEVLREEPRELLELDSC